MTQRTELFQAQETHFCHLPELEFMASHLLKKKLLSDELIRAFSPNVFDS